MTSTTSSVRRYVCHLMTAVVIAVSLSGCGGGDNTPTPPPVVPRFAYLVDATGAISSYAVEPVTGQLRHNGYTLSPAPTSGFGPGGLAAPQMAPAMVVSSASVLHYVARSSTPVIVAGTIDGPTGILTPRVVPWSPGTIPLDLLGHPSGRFLYVVDASSTIQAASIDPTGNLTPAGSAVSFTSVGSVNRLVVDPKGTFILATARAGALPTFQDQVGTIAVNPATGVPSGQWRRTPLPFQPGAVALHPGGRCGVTLPQTPAAQIATFQIGANGAPSSASAQATTTPFIDVAIDPHGAAVFALDDFALTAFPIADATTCALGSPVGPVTLFGGGNRRLSVDPSGKFVYGINPRFGLISAVAIGASPLTLTPTTPARCTTRPGALLFAPVFTSGAQRVTYLPTFLYSVNYGTNDISIFSIDASSGALTPVGTRTSMGAGAFAIAVDPWSRFAYVANRDSNTIAAFTINRSTGALSATVRPVAAASRPVSLAVDPSGRFLFAALNGSSSVGVFTIDQSTGALSPTGANLTPMPQATSLAVEPTGTQLYVATLGGGPSVRTFTINQNVGALASPGPTLRMPITGYSGVAVDPAGLLAFAGDTTGSFIRTVVVNTATGTIATAVNTTPAGRLPVGLAVDPLGRFVYSAHNIDHSVSSFVINRAGDTLTAGTTLSLGLLPPRTPRAILVDPSGQFAYLADEGGQVLAFRVNQTSGALTLIGSVSVTSGGHPFSLAIARLPF